MNKSKLRHEHAVYYNGNLLFYNFKSNDDKSIILSYSIYEYNIDNKQFTFKNKSHISNVSDSNNFHESVSLFIDDNSGLEFLSFVIRSSYKIKIYVLDNNMNVKKYACSFASKSQNNYSLSYANVIDGPRILTIFENKLLIANINTTKLNFTRYKLNYDINNILFVYVDNDNLTLVTEMKTNLRKNLLYIFQSNKYSDFSYLGTINCNSKYILKRSDLKIVKKVLEFNFKMLVNN